MEAAIQAPAADFVELAADVLSAYVSNNSVPVSELPNLLTTIHAALGELAASKGTDSAQDKVERPSSAQIKKSITPEALISFEDGKSYKTLRRHLTLRGLSPEAYRVKYGLSPDYPMTSANYSAQRSELAKSLGLGQQRRGQTEAKAAEPVDSAAEKAPADQKPRRVGRPRKAVAA